MKFAAQQARSWGSEVPGPSGPSSANHSDLSEQFSGCFSAAVLPDAVFSLRHAFSPVNSLTWVGSSRWFQNQLDLNLVISA